MKNTYTFTALICLSLLTPGCITTDKAKMLCPQVESIASIGTKRVLAVHPEYRDGFVSGQIALEQAAADPKLDFQDLAAVLDKLPVRELQNEDARLIIDASLLTIKLLFPNDPAVDLKDYESAQIVAGCLAAGIKQGL